MKMGNALLEQPILKMSRTITYFEKIYLLCSQTNVPNLFV